MGLSVASDIALLIVGGIMMASSVVPMKYATKWRWENIWLLYVMFAQVVFPLILIVFTVPHVQGVYGGPHRSAMANALLFGLGWGVGNVLAGVGYAMLGVGLGLSIVLGLTASAGTLVPLAVLFPQRLMSTGALALYVGVGIMLAGLLMSAQAGRVRQTRQAATEVSEGADIKSFGKGNFRTGLVICIIAGLLSSMLNLAFAFGDGVRLTALDLGASATEAVNALWLPILVAGMLPTLAYCGYLLSKNRSWQAYTAPQTGSHWAIGALMGALFMTALSFYGLGSARLGAMGPVIGFPIFMSTIVLTGNTAGLITGEWKGAPRNAYSYGIAGMILLILSIIAIGLGNSRLS